MSTTKWRKFDSKRDMLDYGKTYRDMHGMVFLVFAVNDDSYSIVDIDLDEIKYMSHDQISKIELEIWSKKKKKTETPKIDINDSYETKNGQEVLLSVVDNKIIKGYIRSFDGFWSASSWTETGKSYSKSIFDLVTCNE